MCITVDDLPTITYSINTEEFDMEITSKLIETFKVYSIPAIGYVCEGNMYSNNKLLPHKIELIDKWLQAGYDLGNHSFSHYNYNKTEDSVFFADILKGEQIIRPLLKKYNKELTYFRHPYLRSGQDSTKKAKLHSFLQSHGYVEAPVTIDNDDYIFAKAYHNAYIDNDSATMKKIGIDYVDYMEKKLLYFESKSEAIFNTQIAHSLLIHASQINADYLDELAEMYKNHGYSFLSQEEILNEPAYKSEDTVPFERGISWMFRWAICKGMHSSVMEGDIDVPDNIMKIAGF